MRAVAGRLPTGSLPHGSDLTSTKSFSSRLFSPKKYGDSMEEGIAMVKLRGESAGAEEETQPFHTSCV